MTIETFNGSGRVQDQAGELAERVKALAYEYKGISMAAVVGAIEIAKMEILSEQGAFGRD